LLSRKKSFEAIPFRPVINHLSERIVFNKTQRDEHPPTHDGPSSYQKKKQLLITNAFASSSKSKFPYTISAFHNNGSHGFNHENLYEQSSRRRESG
jgi:hypothetical protein